MRFIFYPIGEQNMDVLRLAAFSQDGKGGNPAGVVFCDKMPADDEMLRIAKEVGYSETAFLLKQEDGWRVRYFAPAMTNTTIRVTKVFFICNTPFKVSDIV